MTQRSLHQTLALGAIAFSTLSACSFAARSGDIYRADTRELLQTRSSELQQCYEAIRETETEASGQVTASFTVEADTGAVMNPQILTDQTTAPPTLQQCVLTSLQGLSLSPGDNREGQATFTWNFTAAGAAEPPTPAAPANTTAQ